VTNSRGAILPVFKSRTWQKCRDLIPEHRQNTETQAKNRDGMPRGFGANKPLNSTPAKLPTNSQFNPGKNYGFSPRTKPIRRDTSNVPWLKIKA
jgi:hypothetical protein